MKLPRAASLAMVSAGLVFVQTFAKAHQLRANERNNHHKLETRKLESGFVSISVSSPELFNITENQHAQVTRHLEETRSCKLYLEDLHFLVEEEEQDDSHRHHNKHRRKKNRHRSKKSEERIVCTIENYVEREGEIPYPYALEISGHTKELRALFADAGAISGVSVLRWDSAEAVSIEAATNSITLNADVGGLIWIDRQGLYEGRSRNLQLINSLYSTRKQKTRGVLKTILIRIVGDGVAPLPSLTEAHESVFGSENSLKSQMSLCSHGQLTIEPFEGMTHGGFYRDPIDGGAIELHVATNPNGRSDKDMENVANKAAASVLGNLASQFDLVMFMMPPGITPPYAAYAYVGSPFSYFGYDKINDLMVQMHEVGHNLGLQHAGEEDGRVDQYGDPSGYMGYSPVKDPHMCYNPANNYQLGWYSSFSTVPTSEDGERGLFYLSGVDDYDPTDTTTIVSLRLEQPNSPLDYYVGYNLATGMNKDTQEDPDKVIILEKAGTSSEPNISWKKAALSPGEDYVIKNYDNSGTYVKIVFREALPDGTASIFVVSELYPPLTEAPSDPPSEAPSEAPSAPPSSSTTESQTWSGTSSGSTEITDFDTICNITQQLQINVKTDLHPQQLKYRIKVGGDIEYEKRFQEKGTEMTETYCLLPDTCYEFKWFDTGRDGLGAPDSAVVGYYEGFLGDKLLFRREGQEGYEDGNTRKATSFEFCTPSVEIETLEPPEVETPV